METKTLFAQDSSGNALAAPLVSVYLAGTSDLAPIFDGAGNARANPFSAAPSGAVVIQAANGRYDILIQEAGGTGQTQLDGVSFFDPADAASAGLATSAQGAKADTALQPGGNLAGLTDPGAARGVLGLGSVTAETPEFAGDLDAPGTASGWYRVVASASGLRPGGATAFLLQIVRGAGSVEVAQFAHVDGHTFSRRFDGSSWSAWVRSRPEIASQAQAEAGVDNATMMTPLRALQQLLAQGKRVHQVYYNQDGQDFSTGTNAAYAALGAPFTVTAQKPGTRLVGLMWIYGAAIGIQSDGDAGANYAVTYFDGSAYLLTGGRGRIGVVGSVASVADIYGMCTLPFSLSAAQRRSDNPDVWLVRPGYHESFDATAWIYETHVLALEVDE